MKYAAAAGMVAIGYALFYYGVAMYRNYLPNATDKIISPPLSVLLGFPGTKSARPPFQYKVQ